MNCDTSIQWVTYLLLSNKMKLIHACSKRDKSQKHCDSERNQGKKKVHSRKGKTNQQGLSTVGAGGN